jgi:DNA-binding response OmpR family regulator
MIVEDEALIAFSLEDAFGDEGYAITGSFSSCAKALASLGSKLPDVAIVDATLSDGTCLDLARELRRLGVPFLVYSGRNAIDEQAPELEGILWIEKPAPPSEVLRAASKLLARENA